MRDLKSIFFLEKENFESFNIDKKVSWIFGICKEKGKRVWNGLFLVVSL